MQVVALYDYEPEQLDELGFQAGDVLQVVNVQDDGWWSGYNVEHPNSIGLFPSNYVQAPRPNIPPHGTKRSVRTSQHLSSSRELIQQRSGSTFEHQNTHVEKTNGLHHGHERASISLKTYEEEDERASDGFQDAQRQHVKGESRHRKSWQEEEAILIEKGTQQEHRRNGSIVTANSRHQEPPASDKEDDGEPTFGHRSNEFVPQQAEKADTGKVCEQNESEIDEQISVTNAAATVIARRYRQHMAIVERNRERERKLRKQKLNEIRAATMQRWSANVYLKKQRRRHRVIAHGKLAAWDVEHKGATVIQTWIRLRWATFWRKRMQLERKKQADTFVQHEEQVVVEHRHEHNKKKVDNDQQVQCKEKAKDKKEQQGVWLPEQATGEEKVELSCLEANDGTTIASRNRPTPSPPDCRRKVMKTEAAELIKMLVQQQLKESLGVQEARMDELQRMVTRLQELVSKQSVMLENSTAQGVTLQKLPRKLLSPRSHDDRNSSFLPRIRVGQSAFPRQSKYSSGLRAPRPISMSKLPTLTKSTISKQSKIM